LFQSMNMLGALFAFLFFANQSISPAYAIVGGEPAKPHEFPFLASFYLQGKWTGGCGGALISPRHVLSCAHCFKDKKPEMMEVGFGKTSRTDDEGVVKRQVQSFAFHPKLDISIIILDDEVPLSEHVKTIGLPEVGSDYTGQTATLAGPGALGEDGSLPKELMMKVLLKVGTGQKNTTTNTGGQGCPFKGNYGVCATSMKEEPWGSGCGGDSGSPLFVCSTTDACTVLAPIIGPPPYGEQKCDKGDSAGPSVSALRPWIDEVMQGSTNVTPRKGRPMWK